MNTADVLQIFGLEPRETRLYLALLQSGPASIRDIADRAGINRGTTHELLKRMQQKGVVSYFPKGKRRHFSAEPPQRLRELALNHQQQVTEALELLDDKVIPELSHLRPATGNADVHYYEGDDGIELVLKDILSTVSEQENRSYCIYSAKAIRKYLYRPFPNYTRQRVKMGIKVKVIAIGEGGEEAALADRKWINEPSSDRAGSYIAIYPPKVAMISLSHGDLPTAVVINSPTIANTQQVIFNTLWESL
ncbi:MAG: helix-turn-helix domain-containing protein [Saccharospirillum sp.]|uniref:TrmB family transcriptional regulator n=1 Tax=Saccharospirillum TaxID=231683 RepID=UPI00329A1414